MGTMFKNFISGTQKESNKNCNSVTHVKWLNYNKYGNRPKVCLHKWMLEELLPC